MCYDADEQIVVCAALLQTPCEFAPLLWAPLLPSSSSPPSSLSRSYRSRPARRSECAALFDLDPTSLAQARTQCVVCSVCTVCVCVLCVCVRAFSAGVCVKRAQGKDTGRATYGTPAVLYVDMVWMAGLLRPVPARLPLPCPPPCPSPAPPAPSTPPPPLSPQMALKDADRAVALRPDWAKAYSRQVGAGLGWEGVGGVGWGYSHAYLISEGVARNSSTAGVGRGGAGVVMGGA